MCVPISCLCLVSTCIPMLFCFVNSFWENKRSYHNFTTPLIFIEILQLCKFNGIVSKTNSEYEIKRQPKAHTLQIADVFQMYTLLKKINFTNPVGDRVDMKQNKNLQFKYDIFQIQNFRNGLELRVKIGEFSPYFQHDQQLHLYEDVIKWATGSRQVSLT